MRGKDVIHFDGPAYWKRITDPDLTPLEKLRAKEQQKRDEINLSNFGIVVGATGAAFTMGGSLLLALGAARNLVVAKRKHALILEALQKRTPTKDIDGPSTPEGPQASTSTSSASTSTSSSASAPSNQGYEYESTMEHHNKGFLLLSTSSPPPYSAADPTKASYSNGAQHTDWTAQTTAELTSVWEGHSAVSREGGAKSAEPETPPGLPRETTVEVLECGICMEDMQGRAVVGAPCGHMLCRECRVLIVKAATAKGRLARCHFCRTAYAPD